MMAAAEAHRETLNESRRIRVRYHYQPDAPGGPLWTAKTLDGPDVQETARDYIQLRKAMRAQLRRVHGARMKVRAEFHFPEPLGAKLTDLQRDLRAQRVLERRIKKTRLPVAQEILSLRLNQSDVAAMIGITPGRFAALLQAEAERAVSTRIREAAE